jgi:hypothetical protein
MHFHPDYIVKEEKVHEIGNPHTPIVSSDKTINDLRSQMVKHGETNLPSRADYRRDLEDPHA